MTRYPASHNEVCRSYILPGHVASTVPHWGSEGEPGVWNHSRGLAVELSRHLPADPVSLAYHERTTPDPSRYPVGGEVTVIVSHDDHQITVCERWGSFPADLCGDWWEISVNGTAPTGGNAPHAPSLPRIARLVHDHLMTARSGPDTATEGTDSTTYTTMTARLGRHS